MNHEERFLKHVDADDPLFFADGLNGGIRLR
jgi:hypothetical protein